MATVARGLIGLLALTLTAASPPEPLEPSEDAVAAATAAGLDPLDVHAAAHTAGVDPYTYLASTGELQPLLQPLRAVRVRLTCCTLSGRTTSGEPVRYGGTACSTNWRLGTRFRFDNGETFVCNDRGYLGDKGWLDVWNRPDLVRRYGSYADVEVLR